MKACLLDRHGSPDVLRPTDLRLKKPASSPTPNSEPPTPAARDAVRANLSRRPLRPASAKELRNVDVSAQIRLLQAKVLGGIAGGLLGLLAGGFLGHPFLGGLLGALGIGLGSLLFWKRVGEAAHPFFAPAARRTTLARDYSRAETLAVRGHHDDAIAVYQEAIDEIPSDPEPYVRIAGLLTDKVSDPGKVAVWLRRAIQETELPASWEMVLVRELTELFRHRIGAPARAAPLLARIAERHEGSPDGEWAREELADIKRLMAEEAE